MLWSSIEKKDPLGVQSAIAAGENVNDTTRWRSTPLKYAVENRSMEIMEILIKNGADLNLENPLNSAVAGRWLEGVELLLSHGAKMTEKSVETAAQTCSPAIFRLLLKQQPLIRNDSVPISVAYVAAVLAECDEIKNVLAETAFNIPPDKALYINLPELGIDAEVWKTPYGITLIGPGIDVLTLSTKDGRIVYISDPKSPKKPFYLIEPGDQNMVQINTDSLSLNRFIAKAGCAYVVAWKEASRDHGVWNGTKITYGIKLFELCPDEIK